MTVILEHLLAVYVIVLAPWLGCVIYQKAKRRIEAGDPRAKVRLYREIVIEQIITTVAVLGLWWYGGIAGNSIGLNAPRSWTWNSVALVLLCGYLIWSGVRLRAKAEKIRRQFNASVGVLFPDSLEERRWFGGVSLGAGISEELVFRGFLMYYLSLYIPRINTVEMVLVTSLFFGFAHIYQGWKRAIAAGVSGLILAVAYVLSGSLLLPMALHAVGDYRILLILPPQAPTQTLAAEGAA